MLATAGKSNLKKIYLVSEICKNETPLVLSIVESWLKPQGDDAEVSISNYQLFRKDRLHKRGGGVLVYIKQDLAST
ncbi:unnamed protein product, partial [Didymodactylos carnosus]